MKHTGLRKPFAVTALCAAVAMSSLHAWAVTDQEILNDAKSTDQIVTNGLGLQGQRYSTLDALNTNNINQLRPVWGFSGGEKQRGQEAQPLIKDGVMYITGSYSRVYALDARTGKELWQYDARLPDGIMPCCDVINRGVALYDDLVIFGTLDAKLVALNKDTGKVVEEDRRRLQGRLLLTAARWWSTASSSPAFPVVNSAWWARSRPTTRRMANCCGPVRPWKVTWATCGRMARRSRPASPAAKRARPGRATCGRPAARRPGWAVTTIRTPTRCCSAPATRRRGTRTCVPATTCIPPRAWRWTRTTARSSGTSSPRRMTAGTSTASTS